MRGIFLIFLFLAKIAQAQKPEEGLKSHLQPAVFSVTMVMIHDVVNPPAASRFYTYCMLGAYEIVAQNNKEIVSPTAFIKSIEAFKIESAAGYDYRIAALYAILETGRLILPSGYMLEEDQKKLIIALLRDGNTQK